MREELNPHQSPVGDSLPPKGGGPTLRLRGGGWHGEAVTGGGVEELNPHQSPIGDSLPLEKG